MRLAVSKKDQRIWLQILSGICGNLSAGWFGLNLISPGLSSLPFTQSQIFLLTKSIFAGIVFAWFAFKLERISE